MNTITIASSDKALACRPGVRQNPHGGYHIHVQLNERRVSILSSVSKGVAPSDTPVLAGMCVFEDSVLLALQDGQAILVHASEPSAAGSVVYFYHANGSLWRALPVEQLNPGWVLGVYHFRSDLAKFETRLARMRVRAAAPTSRQASTLWATGGWSEAVVCLPLTLVSRVQAWQHSDLSAPHVAVPDGEQSERLSQAEPDCAPQILADVLPELAQEGVQKITYQVGGLTVAVRYVERLGLVAAVNRYCPRQGQLSDGLVMAVLVINRLLEPCPLSHVAHWVAKSGLHLLLGVSDPALFNYDRLADTLLTVSPHWQSIATQVTLQAVEAFNLKVETIHYDLTSVFFHGAYQESEWVEFGYSRDHRPDKRQINLGISATADGEVVLPAGSAMHPGHTQDVTTTVAAHQQLHALFGRSDLLVTGDRIMHSAENMLTIARAHGRFLGPVDWTPYIRRVVAGCPESDFETLPVSQQAGRTLKATRRTLRFQVKEKLDDQARQRMAAYRRQQGRRGRLPLYRTVHFRVRAAIILDEDRQQADAQRRQRRLEAYEEQLEWVCQHLNRGRYYSDSDWVQAHLRQLADRFKDVKACLQVTFRCRNGQMQLTYRRLPKQIAQAARLDGRWLLVTNQPPAPDQSDLDYLDWMVCVYRNHGQVERRMSNLKSDLPIRPLYLHRDDAIVALCFASVLALMLYTLIERDCQADPALTDAGLKTTAALLAVLDTFCLTLFSTPAGHQILWFDTPSHIQRLIWRQLHLPDLASRGPFVLTTDSAALSALDGPPGANIMPFSWPLSSLNSARLSASVSTQVANPLLFPLLPLLFRLYLFSYAENRVDRLAFRWSGNRANPAGQAPGLESSAQSPARCDRPGDSHNRGRERAAGGRWCRRTFRAPYGYSSHLAPVQSDRADQGPSVQLPRAHLVWRAQRAGDNTMPDRDGRDSGNQSRPHLERYICHIRGLEMPRRCRSAASAQLVVDLRHACAHPTRQCSPAPAR